SVLPNSTASIRKVICATCSRTSPSIRSIESRSCCRGSSPNNCKLRNTSRTQKARREDRTLTLKVHLLGFQSYERRGRAFWPEAEKQLGIDHSSGCRPLFCQCVPMCGELEFVDDVWNENMNRKSLG